MERFDCHNIKLLMISYHSDSFNISKVSIWIVTTNEPANNGISDFVNISERFPFKSLYQFNIRITNGGCDGSCKWTYLLSLFAWNVHVK